MLGVVADVMQIMVAIVAVRRRRRRSVQKAHIVRLVEQVKVEGVGRRRLLFAVLQAAVQMERRLDGRLTVIADDQIAEAIDERVLLVANGLLVVGNRVRGSRIGVRSGRSRRGHLAQHRCRRLRRCRCVRCVDGIVAGRRRRRVG